MMYHRAADASAAYGDEGSASTVDPASSLAAAAASVAASDPAVLVREARAAWRQAQDAKHHLDVEVAALRREKEDLEKEEQRTFDKLASLREKANDAVRDIAEDTRTTSIDVLHALLVMLELRRTEDSMTLSNLHEEAVRLDEEVKSSTSLMAVQRGETIKAAQKRATDYHKTMASVAKDQAEVLRLRHERQDLVARTELASLKHAKELFGVPL